MGVIILNKINRIDENKKSIGSRKDRHLRKYSDNFNKMFTFFIQSYRKGLITFCGSHLNEIVFDPNGDEAKYCFRKFENGQYPNMGKIVTRHPNIVRGVLIGKKGWGLFRDQWTDGIVDWSFTREEILNEFFEKNIEIPEPLLKEFDDFLEKKKEERNKKEIERLGSGEMFV